jgi:peptide/nickel transport system permease protein
MPNDVALKTAAPPREIAHTVSPGLWTLAWRRLKTDSVAMVSLAIVVAFILLMIVSGLGLVAKDWAKEVGVNYAPPSWITLGAADAPTSAPLPQGAAEPAATGPTPGSAFNSTVVDPLADVIAELKGGRKPDAAAGAEENKVVDPLADVMKDIRTDQAGAKAVPAAEERRATLPFGGDKWGRDIIAKTIKGSETSIFVGLAAALVAVFIGTVLGAFAGYYGRWVDDVLNWFYSVFSSIPYLLLILAVAAVLQQ